MQLHGSKYFACILLAPGPWGSKGQHSTCSENGHVAYQIKGNHKCSKMVANILPETPIRPWSGVKRSKFKFIKLKGITHAATWWQIVCL